VARSALLFSLSTFLCLVLVLRVRFDPIQIYLAQDWGQFYSLVLIEMAILLPYFFFGTAVGAILSTAGEQVGGVYFSDLAGAAAGGLLSLLLIDTLGAESSIFAAATLSSGAAAILSWRSNTRLRRSCALTVAFGLVLTMLGKFGDPVPLTFPPSKGLSGFEPYIETTRWNSIARIDVVVPTRGLNAFAAGYGDAALAHPYWYRLVTQDGAAPTAIVRPEGSPKLTMALLHYLQALPYVGLVDPEVLVIGVGGGPDVLIGLHHGARHVVGVEVNSAMVDLLTDTYADFSGNLAARSDVEIHAAEGRHFLTRDPRRFDVIQMSGVDTFSALASGAYALAENFLYTVEAHHDLLDHLNPGGLLSIARWLFKPPRETLRLVATQLRALEERGVEEAWDRLVIVKGLPTGHRGGGVPLFPWAETLLKDGPFTREEVERYRAWAAERGFTVVYDPFEQRENIFDRLIRSSSAERVTILESYVYDVSPSVDDRPFFFQFYRLRSVFTGEFLRAEFVAGSPDEGRKQKTGRFGEIPLGLIILLVSVALILVLSTVLILWPLGRHAGSLRELPGKWAVVVYFGLVGLGYMFIEIVLLQKLTVFLGGPTYSMGLTLCSLLFFTGVGAGLSRFLRSSTRRPLLAILGLLLAALGAELLFLRLGVPALLGLGHLSRCLVAVGVIAPVGLLLGFPFPTGLRIVNSADARLVPWAFGVNGCASVLGGMLCVLVSMQFGLSLAWAVAACLYASAGAALLGLPGPGSTSPGSPLSEAN
jgi:hypothetical protein